MSKFSELQQADYSAAPGEVVEEWLNSENGTRLRILKVASPAGEAIGRLEAKVVRPSGSEGFGWLPVVEHPLNDAGLSELKQELQDIINA